MNRRNFIKASGLLGLGIQGCFDNSSSYNPNVLIILVDQMRQPVWFQSLNLPNFERLKKRGVTFNNHFTTTSPCSPSRASLLTGLYPSQHGVIQNNITLDTRFKTLGHVFQNAGYRTPYFGKWHLTDYYHYRHNISFNADDYRKGLKDYGYEFWFPPDHTGCANDGLKYDRLYTTRACKWLLSVEAQLNPWMMTVSIINPHDIFAYPKGKIDTLEPVPFVFDKLPANYYDMVDKTKYHSSRRPEFEWLKDEDECLRALDYYYYFNLKADECVGRILDALEASGMAEDTIIVFTSDHGELCGSHGLFGKTFAYREVTNVPLVICSNDRNGTEVNAMTQSIDIFPTICDMAGIDYKNKLPGLNLNPFRSIPNDRDLDFSIGSGIMAVRNKNSLFVNYTNGECELYDLVNDPYEMENICDGK